MSDANTSSHSLNPREIGRLLDGLELLRKSEYISLSEMGEIAELWEKLSGWISEVAIGINLTKIPVDERTDILDETDNLTPLGKRKE